MLYLVTSMWTLLSAACFITAHYTNITTWGGVAFLFLGVAFLHWVAVGCKLMESGSRFVDLDKKYTKNY